MRLLTHDSTLASIYINPIRHKMITSNIGYIKNDRLYLPYQLLRPLSVVNDTRLFGIYYPSKYKNTSIQHDFVFSPIPHRYWTRIGKYLIRINHGTDAIKKISEYLASERISILISDAVRSGYRFDVWNLTVAFEDDDCLDPSNDTKSYKKETFKRISETKKYIESNFVDYLFNDNEDVPSSNPVINIPHTALPFFFEQSIVQNNTKDPDRWIFEPFVLDYSQKEGALITPTGNRFASIIKKVLKNDFGSSSEWIVFLNTDIRNMTMRAAVIPEQRKNHLIEARYNYERLGDPNSSNGLLFFVLNQFPSTYRIWKMTNRTRINLRSSETGSTTFILEDCSSSDNCFERTQELFNSIKENAMPPYLQNITIEDVVVKPFSKIRITSRIEHEKKHEKKYDVFLSYCFENDDQAEQIRSELDKEGLRYYDAVKAMKGGDKIADEIRMALIDSSEMCLLFSKNAKKNEWVTTEWGGAWTLGKKIVPILFEIQPKELPDRLKEYQYKRFNQLNDYIKELIGRQESNFE